MRRVRGCDQLQLHVEFGVDSAETLKRCGRQQLRAPLGEVAQAASKNTGTRQSSMQRMNATLPRRRMPVNQRQAGSTAARRASTRSRPMTSSTASIGATAAARAGPRAGESPAAASSGRLCGSLLDGRTQFRRLPGACRQPLAQRAQSPECGPGEVLGAQFSGRFRCDEERMHGIGQFVQVANAIAVQSDDTRHIGAASDSHALQRQAARRLGGEALRIGQLEVMCVEPVQLLGVELARPKP